MKFNKEIFDKAIKDCNIIRWEKIFVNVVKSYLKFQEESEKSKAIIRTKDLDYSEIKNETIKESNISLLDGLYRFTNQERGLVTIGFSSNEILIEEKNSIIFNEKTVAGMKDRYVRIED